MPARLASAPSFRADRQALGHPVGRGRIFLAEKPSLAEAIAQALGKLSRARPERGPVAWTVGDDRIAWLFGHMFELAPPEAYDRTLARWSLDTLPIRVGNDTWKRTAQPDRAKHLDALRRLLTARRGPIVHCGDAGREGQLLVDEVLEEFGIDPFGPDVLRLWVRSLAEADLVAALRALEPNRNRRGLSVAARTRQRADWLHGLNYTRLFTLLSGNRGTISVGRVQTPTLKLVVDRDKERETFVPVDHFRLRLRLRKDGHVFDALWQPAETTPGLDPEGRLLDRSAAETLRRRLLDGPRTARVAAFEEKSRTDKPPLPYNLSTLQAACSARFRLTAKETLDVAQSLYETHRVATYPRTDSRHLPLALHRDEAPTILRNLSASDPFRDIAAALDPARRSPAWDDGKVSDHHAIVPTTAATPTAIRRLPEREARVFDLVARSFLMQFLPDRRVLLRTALLEAQGERFEAQGRLVVEPGWQLLQGTADEDGDGKTNGPPQLTPGETLDILDAAVEALRTEPPPPFTDGTLIKAMAGVHRFVADPDIRRRLKETDGIGTEATRADILETLLRRGYVRRDGGTALRATPLGRGLIETIPPELAEPGLTALWEAELRRIEEGTADDREFLSALMRDIDRRVAALRRTSIALPVPADGRRIAERPGKRTKPAPRRQAALGQTRDRR